MIEVFVDIRKPQLDLRLPAETASLPVVRQAVRSLGEAVRADREALEDAELAVSEACANVIEHAYAGNPGTLEVTLQPHAAEMTITVSDRGLGMPVDPSPPARGGLGLAMIDSIARKLEIRPGAERGTDVCMSFDMGPLPLAVNGSAPAAAAPLERIARRIVAVLGAQADMPSDRFLESLLAVELATRHAPGYLHGDRVQLSLSRLPGGFELRLGPLVADGASALVSESQLPVIGSVIERLSDEVEIELAEGAAGEIPGAERLRLRISADPVPQD